MQMNQTFQIKLIKNLFVSRGFMTEMNPKVGLNLVNWIWNTIKITQSEITNEKFEETYSIINSAKDYY